MRINLVSFNIFWYGSSWDYKDPRTDADRERLARVLTRLDAHVFVFQEILDHDGLRELLSAIPGHDYRFRWPTLDGAWLTSATTDPPPTGDMKITCAYDASILELVGAGALRNPAKYPQYTHRRDPYAMRLCEPTTGAEFTLAGVHLKSGVPNPGPNDKDAKTRLRETTFLASWLDGTLDVKLKPFERPPTADVIIMGDYNATETDYSLVPLYDGRELLESRFVVSIDSALPLDAPSEKWSTFLDRKVHAIIDHAFVSPTLSPKINSTLIYAFDLDPALNEDPAGGDHWLRQVTDYRTEKMGTEPVENLYRISDHRPLRITLDLC
jgi:endonuclease/exonuclease/phosphatase family metal-dependent hydrolase